MSAGPYRTLALDVPGDPLETIERAWRNASCRFDAGERFVPLPYDERHRSLHMHAGDELLAHAVPALLEELRALREATARLARRLDELEDQLRVLRAEVAAP